VVSCPHDVIGYKHEETAYRPFHLEPELGLDNCIHGEKGCTSCTRACRRFRAWEVEADEHLFGRLREPGEMSGVAKDILLTRASDEMVHKMGQDGGFESAMLIWLLEHDYVDAALTSFLEGAGSWKARPGVAATKEQIPESAGSRYTYSANTGNDILIWARLGRRSQSVIARSSASRSDGFMKPSRLPGRLRLWAMASRSASVSVDRSMPLGMH
jgi:coenzyme F420 hydrogenase subunit beta